MAMKQASIEVKEYVVSVGTEVAWLYLRNPNATGPFNTAAVGFVDTTPPPTGKLVPSHYYAISYLPMARFADMYHVVQTEKPVYLQVWWDEFNNVVSDVAVSTSAEPPGEGLADPRGRF